MVATRAGLLADTYRFLDHTHLVRSDSPEIMDYLRWVYRRFLCSAGGEASRDPEPSVDAAAVLEILDRRPSRGALMVRDCVGTYTVPCRVLDAMEPESDPWPNGRFASPLAHVEGSLMRNIERMATGHDLLHAGAVSARGRAVIFPGTSGRGKSTLCLKLLQRGFQLLSDEIACVRRDTGMVDPFLRLMKFDEQSRRLLAVPVEGAKKTRASGNGSAEWRLDVADLVPSGVGEPSRLGGVVLLEGFAEQTAVLPVSPLRALFALSKLSLRQPDDASAGLFRLTPHLDEARCFSLRIGDVNQAADVIETLVDAIAI